jgi:hypothetical protein
MKTKATNQSLKFEYYSSIDDMPIFNWFKVQETNDLTWCMKNRSVCISSQIEILESAINRMTDEYIDAYGLSESYQKILRLNKEIRILELQRLVELNLQKQYCASDTLIALKKEELSQIMENAQNKETINVRVHAERFMGRSINVRETSVKEFYDIIEEMQKDNRRKYVDKN